MLKADFLLQLQTGELVSKDDVLSVFDIYSNYKHSDSYILIPNEGQKGLSEVILLANTNGIRVFHKGGWPKIFVTKILGAQACKSNKNWTSIDKNSIPMHRREFICKELIKIIKYKSN